MKRSFLIHAYSIDILHTYSLATRPTPNQPGSHHQDNKK